MTGEFSTSLIDQDQNIDWDESASCTKDSIGNHNIVELKGNIIPKMLSPLERLFSKDDTLLKPTLQSSEKNVLSCNIGTMDQPKMVKVSKELSNRERNKYVKLLQEFIDIYCMVL